MLLSNVTAFELFAVMPMNLKLNSNANVNILKKSKFEEFLSPARQQIWPCSRLKVNVKVTVWYQYNGLVTIIMHAKYQCFITKTSEDMSQVKVFCDRRMDGDIAVAVPTKDEWVLMCRTFAKGGDNNDG